jgi:type IV secretory pathway VirB2 component (pilin)
MKAANRISVLMGMILALGNDLAFAQDATQTAATTAFNNNATWIISMVTGPVCKVVGAFFLFAGIGKLMKQEVMGALMCGVAFLILVLMPQILAMFPQASTQ